MDAEYIQTPASMPPGGLLHFNEYAVTYSFKQATLSLSSGEVPVRNRQELREAFRVLACLSFGDVGGDGSRQLLIWDMEFERFQPPL